MWQVGNALVTLMEKYRDIVKGKEEKVVNDPFELRGTSPFKGCSTFWYKKTNKLYTHTDEVIHLKLIYI